MMEKLIILCIILQLDSTRAQSTSPDLQPTCNSCCQGPIGREGNPGIPGVPGSNGHPGNPGGQKGDKGESVKGDVGPRGPEGTTGFPGVKGQAGQKGDKGESVKGDVGPRGPEGTTGLPGVKGQRGEIGQSPVTHVSAFTAVRKTEFTPSLINIPLPFELFHTNIGDDFDLTSGRFTCEIPGVYMFSYSMLDPVSNGLFISLMKNDTLINSVYTNDADRYNMMSSTAVLQLDTGDQVWLRCGNAWRPIFGNSNTYTSFSGALLHKI